MSSSRSVRLRPWQKRALDSLGTATSPDFLAVATPGAGKTTFALTAARLELARARPGRRVVVVVPTQHLKHQWSLAAEQFDLRLEPEWSATDGLPPDQHGIVVTYQQVAGSAAAVAAVAAAGFAIFDEVHHAAEDRAWGDSLRHAFTGAHRRLSLSGTPFRSDTQAIPFVRYRLDEAEADVEYGYGDALAEGRVVRPVYFPRLNGEMEWTAPDGSLHQATFDDALIRQLANQRLRTALSLDGEWLPAVLGQAHQQLTRIRAVQPDAAGLVIAMDQDHARGVAQLLEQRFATRAAVAVSDDPGASDRIARFTRSGTPWLVAVRMVSEGVDIPRLRVGVFATNTTTELFFRQAVGRLVRWVRGAGRQRAYLFIPDDARLRAHAHQIADQRRHSLRKRHEYLGGDEREEGPAVLEAQVEEEQLSLFAALAARPIGAPEPADLHHDDLHDDDGDPRWDGGREPDDDPALELALAPLAGSASAGRAGATGATSATSATSAAGVAGEDQVTPVFSHREERRRLRDLNAAIARELAVRTGSSHAQVNAELNRLAGVRKVTEATNAQLGSRIAHGRSWLAQLSRARR
ncbi:MAG: ATP-dependent helicase [Acidimicrobiia bacterium]|nr:ATP-dependent helicase [Acidimicrobiia bacterium]